MADYTVKRYDEMEAVYGGAFQRVRAELGVESFGVQMMDLPPNVDAYPAHDHVDSGQEEVFVVVNGGGEIELDGERVAIDTENVIRVGPEVTRKLLPGDQGMRVLALGGVPGQAYEPTEMSKLGAPDPMAAQS